MKNIPEFSMTTDMGQSSMIVAQELAAFAAAGFRAFHWCQNWFGEPVFYPAAYFEQVRQLAAYNGLRMADVHAYSGTGGGITYTDELFLAVNANRAEFAQALGADVLVVHLPVRDFKNEGDALAHCIDVLGRLRPIAERHGQRVAVENGLYADRFLDRLLDAFPPEYLGFCYDSGHALLPRQWGPPAGEALLERFAGRLIAAHLHDNDGTGDQHRIPGQGKADWPRIVRALRKCGYSRAINLEVLNTQNPPLGEFCKQAYQAIDGIWRASSGV